MVDTCSRAILIRDYAITSNPNGPTDADGVAVEHTGWSDDWQIDGKRLVLSRHDGRGPTTGTTSPVRIGW